MTEILRQSTPVAKKDHECFWCGLTIPKGLKHSYEVQVFDGEFNAIRAHSCWWLHSRTALIKWLSLLPVKVHDSKINKVLKLNYD